jgi:hypothetical protein
MHMASAPNIVLAHQSPHSKTVNRNRPTALHYRVFNVASVIATALRRRHATRKKMVDSRKEQACESLNQATAHVIGRDTMRTGNVREQGFKTEGCQETISVWREGVGMRCGVLRCDSMKFSHFLVLNSVVLEFLMEVVVDALC